MLGVIFLGPIKQPEYCHGADWFDEDNEQIKYYHVTAGNYRVGDEARIYGERYEVYGVEDFSDESELCDYLDENYPDIKEI